LAQKTSFSHPGVSTFKNARSSIQSPILILCTDLIVPHAKLMSMNEDYLVINVVFILVYTINQSNNSLVGHGALLRVDSQSCIEDESPCMAYNQVNYSGTRDTAARPLSRVIKRRVECPSRLHTACLYSPLTPPRAATWMLVLFDLRTMALLCVP
jgi:hypothetical protein